MGKGFNEKINNFISRQTAIEEKFDKKLADKEKIIAHLYKELDNLKKD